MNRGLIDNLSSLKYFISRLNFINELGWNFGFVFVESKTQQQTVENEYFLVMTIS